MSREDFAPHSPFCDPGCISGEQLKAAMEILGLWFDGNILSVKLGNRDGVLLPGHPSSWYAEIEVTGPGTDEDPRYHTSLFRVPVHPGPSEMERMSREP